MTTFSAADLANMRTAQETHMMDTCVVQPVIQILDSMRELVEAWPDDSTAIACGLDMRPGIERHGIDNVILKYDAVVRLPITTVIDTRDRIKVTKRFGEDIELIEATTNLVANPSLETGIVGWIDSGTNIVAQSTDQARYGVKSLKCTWKDDNVLAWYSITLANAMHTGGIWVYIPSSWNTSILVSFAGFTGAVITEEIADISLKDQWQFIAATIVPDAGDLSGFFVVKYSGIPDVNDFIYVDAAQCEAKAYPTRYCDGSLGRGHTWAGTAHASVSSRAQTMLVYEIAGPIQRGSSGIRLMLNRIET